MAAIIMPTMKNKTSSKQQTNRALVAEGFILALHSRGTEASYCRTSRRQPQPRHLMLRDRLKQLLLPCFSFRFTNYSTSNAMSSAWSPLPSSSATVHGTGPLLQSTAAANIIFINIDWKRSRHANPRATKRNLKKLANTTSSIVTNMKPAVICCCEVGTMMSPMTRQHMLEMVDAMRIAWEETATEHPAISFLFEDDAPYLTIWDDNRCKCTHAQILKNVYNVPGHRRTAQAFLCTICLLYTSDAADE